MPTGYSDDSYLLASAASEIWLNPLGAVAIAGPGGQNLYFKGLLDKLGVTANIYRVGTYKAAVEPFTRNDMSPEARENAQALGNALLETWRAERRQQPAQGQGRPLYDGPGRRARRRRAATWRGPRSPRGWSTSSPTASSSRPAGASSAARTTPRRATRRSSLAPTSTTASMTDEAGSIGVVTVAGTIVDGKARPGPRAATASPTLIDQAVAEGGIEALVVRVDSPGGSVLASERIRQALLDAKAEGLPMVVSMGSVAASGGYWVATPADFIFAEPSTITGSIGVFGILPSFQGTLEKLGIGADGIKTTPLSGEPDLLNGPSPEVDRVAPGGVEFGLPPFLTIVAQSRKRSPARSTASPRAAFGTAARRASWGWSTASAGSRKRSPRPANWPSSTTRRARCATSTRPRASRKNWSKPSPATDDDEDEAAATCSPRCRPRRHLRRRARAVGLDPGRMTIQARCLECPRGGAGAECRARDLGLLASCSISPVTPADLGPADRRLEGGSRRGRDDDGRQMWIGLPVTAIAASFSASECVGWAWQV